MDIENIVSIQKLFVPSFVNPHSPPIKALKWVSRYFNISKRRNICCMLKQQCEQKIKLYKLKEHYIMLEINKTSAS